MRRIFRILSIFLATICPTVVFGQTDGWTPLQIPLPTQEPSAPSPPAPVPQDTDGWTSLPLALATEPVEANTNTAPKTVTPKVKNPAKSAKAPAPASANTEWQSLAVSLDVDEDTLRTMLVQLRDKAKAQEAQNTTGNTVSSPQAADVDRLLASLMQAPTKGNKTAKTTQHAALPGTKGDYYNLQSLDPRLLKPEPLTDKELEFARTAWSYFKDTPDKTTGFVPSVRKFKSMTLWDQGGYILAVCSAYKLGLIPKQEATLRLSKVFKSLAKMPLYKGKLPNKAYNVQTLQMTDYANRPKPKGVGYSALDIMRLMSGVLVAQQTFPELVPATKAFYTKWDLAALAKNGRFHGVAIIRKRAKRHVQEGRIGYEQYAGMTGMLLGLPVETAYAYAPILRWHKVDELHLPADNRTKKTHGVSAVTTSEPFLLEVLEYGWRPELFPVAWAVFRAHLLRHNRTGILTALSEDHIKGPPYFAYNGILVDNEAFKSVTASRKDVSDKRGTSAKASFGWWALTRHPYTFELLNAVDGLQTENGWFAGLFEQDQSPNKILTLNTNAVILEALHYKAFGPLYKR